MQQFRDKLQVFFMGLMLGLLVGVGFFLLKLDDYFKELNFYKHISLSQDATTKESDDSKSSQPNKNGSSNATYKAPLKMISPYPDSTDRSEQNVSQANQSSTDTAQNHADIVVMKDELIGVKQLDVINNTLTASGNGVTNKDSLLQKYSDIRDDRNNPKQQYAIEYWHSPINYKGYKLSKNKVILFGITMQDEIALVKLDDGLFLKIQQVPYKLELNDDFRQFEKVSDESLLARLK